MDTIRLTVFFFRNNHSTFQTVYIPVDVLDPPKTQDDVAVDHTLPRSRIRGPLELNVKSVKAASQSLSFSVIKIE